MYTIFLTTLTNEIIGLLPITIIQIGAIIIDDNISTQLEIALAFAIGNFVLYYLGRFGSIPILKILKKYKPINDNSKPIKTNFFWIIVMRSIPFFPAKHVSIALGALKYNIFLFFISSFIGIFLRGVILIVLYRIGLQIQI